MKNKKLKGVLGLGTLALGAVVSFAGVSLAETTTPASPQAAPLQTVQSTKGNKFHFSKKHAEISVADQAKMKSMRASKEAIAKALEAGDYAAFHTAVIGNAKAEAITQDQFNIVIQGKKIMQDAELLPKMGNYKTRAKS